MTATRVLAAGVPAARRALARLSGVIERRALIIVAIYSLLLAVVVGQKAVAKPFWHDEIYTILVADQPTLRSIWLSGADGLDAAPPLNALATRLVHRVAGSGPIATRLPGFFGYLAASLIVFRLVCVRSNAAAGLCGVLILFFSAGRFYAFEARPYGLMLGLFAAALLAWSEATAGIRRRAWIPVLAVLLTASLWNHYYAVLTFIPIAAGEAVRLIGRRRVDWGIAGAVGVAVLSLVPLAPHLGVLGDSLGTYYHRASLRDIGPVIREPLDLLSTAPFALLYSAVLVAMAAGAFGLGRLDTAKVAGPRLPSHEIAAGIAGLAIPAMGLMCGVFVTGVFVPHYGLPVVVALAAVAPVVVARATRSGAAAMLLLCGGLSTAFVLYVVRQEAPARQSVTNPVNALPSLVPALEGPQPVVIGHISCLEFWYYASPSQRQRVTCVANPAAELRFTGSDSVDRDYLVLGRWSTVNIREYAAFVAATPEFRLYTDLRHDWLARQLTEDGARLTPRGRDEDFTIYDVSVPPRPGRTGP